MLRILITLLLTLFSCCVVASDTQQQMADVKQQSAEAMQGAREVMKKADPAGEFARANEQLKSMPVMKPVDYSQLPEVTDQTLKGAGLDIQKLVSQGKAVLDMAEASKPETQSLQVYVMISMSMPDALIMNLWGQAEKIHAPLVIRGFVDGDLISTQKRVLELYGINPTAYEKKDLDVAKVQAKQHKNKQLDIDPTLFQRFGIQRVPAIVVAKGAASPCMEQNCPVPEHYVVYGDITLEYALKLVSEENGNWRAELEALSDRLVRHL